ncbi:glycosyltransferase [Bacteroides bouchesdurhonensis]|uniref:glycosyltransferase n=1 Tax=Bacteroides bouchesdurhonensis TaxID=1841855 RepID=UPI00097F7D15|nr:glycosyltransferase [Bacteroides bouchesdurhonensis]
MQRLYILESVYKNDKANHLKDALDSIFSQSYGDFKLLLFVDGPISDMLWNVINSYTDERFEVINSLQNHGLAFALNQMLMQCKDADYIARMDADDISVHDRFEKQVAFLEAHPKVDVVGGAINEIDENGNDRGKVTRYPCEPDACRAFFAKRNPVAHPTVMFRRSFFEKAGWAYPTDFERNEDTRLWHEGYKHGCVIANLPDVLLNFRMTDSMFKQRRNGHTFAESQLQLRKMIAKDLGYGAMAYVYAYAMYLLMISPSWILKFAYKILR